MNPRYRDRIKEHFPNLDINTIHENKDGLINDVLILNEERVFRFAKNNDHAKKTLMHEILIVELISQYVGVTVPEFDIVEEDFVSYQFIPGKPLLRNDIVILNHSEQVKLAQQLAQFLKDLHTIPEVKWTENEIGPSDVNRNYEVWSKLYEDIQDQLFPHMMGLVVTTKTGPLEKLVWDT